MDDKYIKDIYDNLGGKSVFGDYNDYYSLITSDDSYIKDVYNSQGESVFGSYDDFVSLVKKKDDSEPTSQEVATESITKEEKQPTLSDASESKFDYESFIDKDEDEAIYDLQSELTAKGYSVEETGIGNALLVTDNIFGEQTEIDLQPISWLGKGKYRAEEIEKVKKLIQTPTDSRRSLLSTNQLEAYTSDRASYLQDLKNKYPNFQFEYVQDPQRGGTIRITKGDAVGEFEVKRGTFEDSKQFTAINNFLYQNMTDEEASDNLKKIKIDQAKIIQQDIQNINTDIDISMESAEADFYGKDYFKGLFKALEEAGVSVPEEARRELESGYTTTTTYNPVTGSAQTLVPMGSQEIKDGIQRYFGSDPSTMEKINQYNLAGTIAVRKQKIDRSKKLATEIYYDNHPNKESVKEIVLQINKDITDKEADIIANIEMARKDITKLLDLDAIQQEVNNIAKKNEGIDFEVISDENKVLQNIISSEPVKELEELKNRIKNSSTAYITLLEKSKYELEKINSKSKTVDQFMEAANRNYNLIDMATADLKNAFTQLGGGMAIIQTLAEGAVEDITGVPVGLTPTSAMLPADVKMKMIRSTMAESREKVEKFYKTKRTYDESIKEGSKFEFGVRTFAEQFPNISLAFATAGVGPSISLGKVGIQTLIATEFGITSAGQKYDELTTRQEFGAIAEKGLKELESIKGIISDEEYLVQKYELERALEDSKISSKDKTLAVIGTGLVEFGISRSFGTVPNSIKVLKDLKAPTKFMDDILRSNYTAAKQAVKEFGKRTRGEIIEETSIDLLTQINDYAFLGDQIDLSSLDDVTVTSIITSGVMNTPSTAYSTIMTQTNVNRYKSKINSLTQEIGTLKDMLMDTDISSIQRAAIHNNINKLISGIAEQTTNMEGDALLMGADNIKEMLTLSGVRNSMLKKAGVENDDSYDVANAKIDNYLKSLDQDAAKKFTDQMKYIDNRRNEVLKSINYEGAVERVFGEKGTEIAKGLDPTLTPQQKYVEVYKQIRQEINDNALKEFKNAIQEQEIPDEILNLKDDEVKVLTVENIEDIPEQFRDRAEKKEGTTVKVRRKILGLPIGKETEITIGEGYSYTLTGKEIKDYAIQEQETGVVPDAKPAEGVQEVEEEVRVTDKKAEKVSDLLNRPVTLTELGGSKLDVPIEGDMYVEGQQVVVEDADGNITEIGNVDKVSGKTLVEMGISQQDSNVKTDTQGNLVIGEDTLVPDKGGIKRNKRGDITSVTLRTPDGSITRTLRGANAEEAAYQILLKEAQSPEQVEKINQLLEQDEEFQNELRQAEAASKAEADTDTEQVTEPVVSKGVKVKNAPKGTYIDVEMIAGKDGRKLSPEEVLDAIPLDGIEFDNDGKNLRIKLPRELTPTEMMSLMKATEQEAIGQIHNGVGKLYAQSKKLLEDYGNEFNEEYFKTPREGKLKKYEKKPKAGNRIFNEPLKAVKDIADKYYERVFGKKRPKFEGVKKIDKEFAKRISDAFEAMKEDPNDPEVKAAYEAMAKETMAQYQDFKDAGYTIEINNSEPYKNAQEMIDDLRDNKRMKIFSTESGFGDTAITDKQRKENPLLRDSGVKDVNGETLLVNDIFRAVHDFYGHAELGNGFGPIGEENAWNVHARMFSPLARRAMTTETRGQNSYVNFSGINNEAFKLRDKARRLRKEGKEAEAEALVEKVYEIMKFADQKVGLLPEEFSSLDKVTEAKVEGGVQQLRDAFGRKADVAKKKQVSGRPSIDEIRQYAKENKISDADVRTFLKEVGYTEDQIKVAMKKAPSVDKILGKKPIKKTVDTYAALKDQIRLESRAAREAQRDLNTKRKDLASMIKDLAGKGVITANQSTVLINRVSSVNLNNERSVEKLVEYMDKVYQNAEYADNILRSNKGRKRAKKNIRSKIGSANVVFNTLKKLFSIDAKLIPQDVLDTYNDLVNQFGESRAVLNLEDISVVNEKANLILEAIDNEVSEIPKLQLLFEGLNKVISRGKEDFSETIDQALAKGEITKDDHELMKKYKKDIVPAVDKVEVEAEPITFEFKENNIEDSMENEGAERLIELLKNKKAVDQLRDDLKKNIQAVIDNIDAGFFPSYANNIANEIESIIAKDNVVPRIKKGKYVFDRVAAKINKLFSPIFTDIKRSTTEYQIRQNPLSDIDNVLGNMNRTDIYDNIFGKAAKSYANLDAQIDIIHEKIAEADALLFKQFKRNGNKVTESKFRIMAYMLEREFQSNKDSNKVFSAKDAIKAAIESQKKGETTIYSKKDIKILKSILKEFEGDVNLDSVFNKFSKREKKAISIIDDVNKSIADKALYTASVIRGARPNMIENYVHHSVASSNENTVESITSKYNQFKTFSTKAGTLVERTPGVKPLNFDVLNSTLRGAKETLTDYHMTDTARVIFKTLNKIQADILADENSTDRQIETANALKKAFDTAMRQVFEMNYVNNGMNFLGKAKGLGYKAMLASVPRAAAEMSSNFAYVLSTSPKSWTVGAKYTEYTLDQRGRDIMINLNSEQTGKLYSKKVTGKTADVGLFVDSEGATPTGAVNGLQNKANQILSYLSKVTIKPTEKIAESLISTPDRAISRPLWFGSLDTKFKDITGKKIDMEAIRNGDKNYLKENKEALKEATRFADKEVTRAATSINVFNGVLKNKIDPNDSSTLKIIREINGFMTNFMIYEYTTARSAISALINSGQISRQKGASLLLGTTARMSLYMVLYQYFSHLFDSTVAAIFGADIGDEEMPEEDLLARQLVGSVVSLIVGKNLGNLAKIVPNMALEVVNEKYLEDLRNGEDYDPYKHSIAYSMLSREDLKKIETGQSGPGDVLLQSFSGPYSPTVKTLTRAVKLVAKVTSEKSKDATKQKAIEELNSRIVIEMLGNMGMIPFYKDVRRIVIKDFFNKEPELSGYEKMLRKRSKR